MIYDASHCTLPGVICASLNDLRMHHIIHIRGLDPSYMSLGGYEGIGDLDFPVLSTLENRSLPI